MSTHKAQAPSARQWTHGRSKRRWVGLPSREVTPGDRIFLATAGHYSYVAFGAEMQMHWPDVDLIVGRAPGEGAPALFSPSIGVLAAAYSHALVQLFPGRSIFGCGVSTGALILLALHGLDIRILLLIEPPIRQPLATA